MKKMNWMFLSLIATSLSTLAFTAAETATGLKVKPDPGKVALTFDDGPDARYTPKVLEILERHNIKATFFLVGEMAKARPALVLAIKNAGHVIANHSYRHPDLRRVSAERLAKEIEDTSLLLHDLSGQTPKCLRPPYGGVNGQVRQIAQSLGLEVLTWDVSSEDYRASSPERAMATVLSLSKPGDVILMHDANRGGAITVQALEPIIKGFQNRHIGFDTICD